MNTIPEHWFSRRNVGPAEGEHYEGNAVWANGICIAYCHSPEIADMVGATPDLLKACKMVMRVIEWADRNNKRIILECCDWGVVRNAIEKAEGREL